MQVKTKLFLIAVSVSCVSLATLLIPAPAGAESSFSGMKIDHFLGNDEVAASENFLGDDISTLKDSTPASALYKVKWSGKKYVLFAKNSAASKTPKPSDWVVTDAIPYPEMNSKDFLYLGDCSGSDIKENDDVIALVSLNQNDRVVVKQAWRADRTSGKIESVASTEGVTCSTGL